MKINDTIVNKGILQALPCFESKKKGWPWTEQTSPDIYQSLDNIPTITIVTPTRNQGHFIEETIRSILLQNYPKLEFIVMDGKSTDQTVEILKKYDTWIDYWESENDKGQTHAINKGFQRAKGDLINWVNSDDILAKNGLFNLVKGFAKHPEATLIHGQSIVILENGHLDTFHPPGYPDFKLAYFGSFPYLQPATFYKRAVLSKIGFLDESFEFTMDRDFFIRIALNYSIQYLDEPIAYFREQPDAKTFKYNDTWESDRQRVISKLMRTLKAQEMIILLKKLSIYSDGKDVYPISIELSRKQIKEILIVFFEHSITLNFHANRFEETFQITKNIKTISPDYFSDKMVFYYGRSKFYRFKLIYRLTRVLAIFKKWFTE